MEELDAVGDRQLYVGTPHIEDTIYNTLENDRSFNVLKKLVWRDEAHTVPQCPEMHSIEWIEEKQRKNRAGHFKSQYLLIPARSVEAQFSFDRVNVTNDALVESDWETRVSIRGQRSVFYIGDEEVVDIRAYWDPASGLKNRDDSVIAVVAKTCDDSVHVVHVEALPAAEGNDYDAQCHVVLDVCRRHFVNEVLVETNFNPILESQLKKYAKERRGRRLRVRGVRRTTATRKMDFIADTLDALMRTGLLCVNEQVLGTDFKNQLESFPFGRHDDILDAIAGAVDELIPTRVRGEAWMVEPKFIGGEIDMNIAPSENSDRMECLIIAAVGRGGQSVIEIHEIERNWKDGFSGLRKREFPQTVEVGGAFAEILD